MEAQLCPYPGLRPFNEKESIFFKGRETNINQIIEQLEDKRFMMITGASGDGKSSIVYAGVIPNIKAGFIKASYNAWRFSIIKPEEKPLVNLSNSLAEIFKLSPDKLYEDLSFGFSSIVELYKNSEFYIDNESPEWQNLPLEEKKLKRAKAANLFILVDQFEEFFTNRENFYNGEPTLEAETAINLLVETVRVANEEKLPIYIVFTMRADFIGNSPAFRGLPELVGFSHFFIPRLKREEIEKIILEPALLNGDSISDQLVNYLSSAATDGTDQLPIIQHALNRIWNIARENGNEEMDIIHLAMAGGIDPGELSDSDRKRFNDFFEKVPAHKKSNFRNPSLQNVINAHADELLEDTVLEFNSKSNKTIEKDALYFALKRSFQTLTKIDEGRSVRHRSSVSDLIGNINIKNIELNELNILLGKFREPGNTLLNPFTTAQPVLKSDSVIDITHEALIRNWDKLKEWSVENEENLSDYNDFNKQLLRWKASNNSNHFLLPLGPLEQFESWYKNALVNEYWLVKYDESADNNREKLRKAKEKISDINIYLKTSREHLNDIEAAKKRKNKILVAAAVAIMVVLSGLTLWALNQKDFATAQQKIADEKRLEAEASKSLALQSKEEAEKARSEAQVNEQSAVQAKESAMKAKKDALLAKAVAEKEKQKADQQSSVAVAEAQKAEMQRQVANEAKEKALVAEKKAKNLTLTSLSQNLALKSTLIEKDNTLQALLALQAYKFTVQNNENVQNPIIYEGLRAAYFKLIPPEKYMVTDLSYEPRGLSLINNKILTAGKSGFFNTVVREPLKLSDKIELPQKELIRFIALSSKNRAAIAFENGNVSLYEITENKAQLLKTLMTGSGVSFLTFSEDGDILGIATTDNKINLFKASLSDQSLIASYTATASVKALCVNNDGSSLWFSNNAGEIIKFTVSTKSTDFVYTAKPAMATALTFNKEQNKLAAGFSDGRLRIIDLNSNKVEKEFNDHTAAVEIITFNGSKTLLASSGADKTIRVYDLQKESKPITLRNHQSKVRSLIFTENMELTASCADKSIRVWGLSSDEIAKKMCGLIQRNLSGAEWQQNIGDEIDYQKTCDNLQSLSSQK